MTACQDLRAGGCSGVPGDSGGRVAVGPNCVYWRVAPAPMPPWTPAAPCGACHFQAPPNSRLCRALEAPVADSA
eukprot:11524048-Alexandrium_andersonii.AAC.1